MEKQNEQPIRKAHAFFVLFISAFMITISFTLETNKKDIRILSPKKVNLTKEKSPNYLFNAHKARIALIDGDTVDVVIVGRKPFLGEVVVISDSIEGGEYLVK